MKDKGYTLIELLGVMMILALLVSFVIPSIINTLKSSTDKKDNLTNDLIINAAEMYVEDNGNEFNVISQKTYCITIDKLVDGNYLKDSVISSNDDKNKIVKVTYIDKFNYEVVDNDDCIEPYANGDVVYFDVEKGKGCSEEDYDVTNSNTGYNGYNNKTSATDATLTDKLETQNSCLKFYAFNDDGKKTVNLLLDHNTTAIIAWKSELSNTNGPKEIMQQLKIDTEGWKGTNTPSNYTVTQTTGGNYTIDYSLYNARLITANEIAEITNNSIFKEATTSYTSWYYFHDLSTTETTGRGDVCASEGCQYRWIYDRTNTSCEYYGCLNNSEIKIYGYWTATSSAMGTKRAWVIEFNGSLNSQGVDNTNNSGVRPVITVLKENLK